jgi:hypothetical protein
VVLGLLVGEPALPAKLLDQRVVGGQQLQLTAPVEVRAAVADVGERDLLALEQCRGKGRAHARDGGVLLREVVDAVVRGLCDRPQPRLGRLVAALRGLERLGGDARRDLAGLSAAHPVGDRKQRRTRDEGVLVGRPLAPGVGAVSRLGDPKH